MDEKRFTLRMDGELFEEISETAEKHRRSIAKEVESAIAFYLHAHFQEEFNATIDRERLKNDNVYAREIAQHDIALRDKYKIYK